MELGHLLPNDSYFQAWTLSAVEALPVYSAPLVIHTIVTWDLMWNYVLKKVEMGRESLKRQ